MLRGCGPAASCVVLPTACGAALQAHCHSVRMFSSHIYVIPGFRQHLGTQTRLTDLYEELHGLLCGPECSVQIRPWDNNWKAEAAFVARYSCLVPRIIVVAYSWGAGHGFVQFEKYLRRAKTDKGRKPMRVSRACLIDPVYRHRYLLGNWRAFVPWIQIPVRADLVTWWRQSENHPMGHDLKPINGTVIEEPIHVEARHDEMDDQEFTIKRCKEICLAEVVKDDVRTNGTMGWKRGEV